MILAFSKLCRIFLKYFHIFPLLLLSFVSMAQKSILFKVSEGGEVNEIAIELDNGTFVNVSPTGEVYVSSTQHSEIDYFSSFDSDEFHGKAAKIGNVELEYYRSFKGDEINGKLWRVGNVTIEYYRDITTPEISGKVSKVGGIGFDYFRPYDGVNRAGKVSKIGSAEIDYYAGGERNGKISSFGNVEFQYFTRADAEGKAGKIRKVVGQMERVNILINFSTIK